MMKISHFLLSSVREAFIKAKYVDCVFVKPLVPKEKSGTIQKWTVARRQRRTLLLDGSTGN